jgi:hypothetical protein
MKNTITVIYPIPGKKRKQKVLAARQSWEPESIDISTLKDELVPLLKMLDELDEAVTRFSIDEAKVSVGLAKDAQGKLHVGISAKVLQLVGAELSGELGSTRSENQLLELTIRRRTTPPSATLT